MRKKHKERGFTLIEVTLAGVVFAIAFMGLSAALAQGTHLNDTAREALNVATATRSLFEEINDTPWEQIQDKYHKFGFEIEGLAPDPETGGPVGTVLVEDVDSVPGLKKVTLVVRYRRHGDIKTTALVRYLTAARLFGNTTDPNGPEGEGEGGEVLPEGEVREEGVN